MSSFLSLNEKRLVAACLLASCSKTHAQRWIHTWVHHSSCILLGLVCAHCALWCILTKLHPALSFEKKSYCNLTRGCDKYLSVWTVVLDGLRGEWGRVLPAWAANASGTRSPGPTYESTSHDTGKAQVWSVNQFTLSLLLVVSLDIFQDKAKRPSVQKRYSLLRVRGSFHSLERSQGF